MAVSCRSGPVGAGPAAYSLYARFVCDINGALEMVSGRCIVQMFLLTYVLLSGDLGEPVLLPVRLSVRRVCYHHCLVLSDRYRHDVFPAVWRGLSLHLFPLVQLPYFCGCLYAGFPLFWKPGNIRNLAEVREESGKRPKVGERSGNLCSQGNVIVAARESAGHQTVLRSSYNLPVLCSYCNSFFHT